MRGLALFSNPPFLYSEDSWKKSDSFGYVELVIFSTCLYIQIARHPNEKLYLSLWLDRCFMIHLTVISVALWMMSAEFWEIGTSVWSTSVLLIVRFNDSSSPC